MIRIFKVGNWRHRAVMALAATAGIVASIVIDDRKTAALVFLGAVFVFGAYFIVSYGFWSNWRATIVGRAMFWLATSFFSLVAWLMIGWVAPGFPFRDDIRELLYLFFALMFLQMDLTLRSVQKAGRRGRPLEDLSEFDERSG